MTYAYDELIFNSFDILNGMDGRMDGGMNGGMDGHGRWFDGTKKNGNGMWTGWSRMSDGKWSKTKDLPKIFI